MDSDSDWDSLPGDPEPPSEYQTTPKAPQPPIAPIPQSSKSPRTMQPSNGNNTSTQLRKAVKTPSKSSIPSTESSTNNKPNQMYGKPAGVTTFVDHSYQDIKTISNKKDSKKGSGESVKLDSNSNTVISGSVDKKMSGKALELKDLNPVEDTGPLGRTNEGFHSTEEPPYTNFRDALPANDVRESNHPEQRRGRIKSAYIRNKTPDNLDGSMTPMSSPRSTLHDSNDWNGWNIRDEEDKQIENSQLTMAAGKDTVDGRGHILDVYGDENLCIPYEKKGGTGYTYIFNHGKTHYLNVVPEWREPYMKTLGERTEKRLTYFWQEFFGALALVVDFGLIFVLELMKFAFRKVLVKLLVGFIVIFGDHFLKPVLAAIFNSFLQPTLAFFWNAFLGLKNGTKPLLDISREVILQITTLIKGFRLFELNWKPIFTNTQDNSQTSIQRAYRQQIQEI